MDFTISNFEIVSVRGAAFELRISDFSSGASLLGRNIMKAKNPRWWFAIFLVLASFVNGGAHAGQKDLQKLTVGYTPISGATLPLFIAVEEKIFEKHGFEVSPIFMGGSPLVNSAILAGEFPIGFTGGGGVISSRLAGSDLILIGSPLQVLTIDGWARPE